MTSTLSVISPAPLEYRWALDAAMSALAGAGTPLVLCDAPDLLDEIERRLAPLAWADGARAALWVEPSRRNWRAHLDGLAAALPPGAPLAIIAARPLARLLPERRGPHGQPLGYDPGGLARLSTGLVAAGFARPTSHGLHAPAAIWLSLLGGGCARWGRPDLGDRLQAAARLHYRTSGPLAALSTVALLVTRKERA